MKKNFISEANPSDPSCELLAELAPTIPYYTSQYRTAMQTFGKEIYLIGVESGGNLLFGCLAEMRSGRLSRELSIQSTPSNADQCFWQGLSAFCKALKVTHLSLGTVGTCPQIPSLGDVVTEKIRNEYWVDLTAPNLKSLMKGEQRRIFNRAAEAGLSVRQLSTPEGLDKHNQLTAVSLNRRRHRGESIPFYSGTTVEQALINSGLARLYECVQEDKVLGSVIITLSKMGAHGYSAGYSIEGFKTGAGVFLNHTTFNLLKDEGKILFNLGDAPAGSGLALFKKNIGGVLKPSRAVNFYTGSLVLKLAVKATTSLRKTMNRVKHKLL